MGPNHVEYCIPHRKSGKPTLSAFIKHLDYFYPRIGTWHNVLKFEILAVHIDLLSIYLNKYTFREKTTKMSGVCIVGMHRSGTSMIAHILHECGLYLGPQEKWGTVAYSNPDGFWEHVDFLRINDEILSRFDGGWDYPPSFPENWQISSAITDIRKKAQELVQEFSDRRVWGWKDPRNSLTLPFWKTIIPDLRIVHCVRSPIEVCKSLNKRSSNSEKFGFTLWEKYITSILENATGESYIATNYHNYFLQPVNEITRLAEFTGLHLNEKEIERISALVIKQALFNHDSTLDELLSMPERIQSQYIDLCRASDQKLDQRIGELESISDKMTSMHFYEKDRQVQLLMTQITAMEQQISVLAAHSQELQEIKTSRAWQLVQFVWRTKSRFMPSRSKPLNGSS